MVCRSITVTAEIDVDVDVFDVLDGMTDDLQAKLAAAERRAATAEKRAEDMEKLAQAASDDAERAIQRAEAAEAERDTLAAQVAGLQKALQRLGVHQYDCAWTLTGSACSCGLDAALSASPSTRTAALIRAGEAAVEETRAEGYDDHRSSESSRDYLLEARQARREACTPPTPDSERER